MWGLIRNEANIKEGKLDMNLIAEKYRNWYDSRPFDIGNTTRSALSGLNR